MIIEWNNWITISWVSLIWLCPRQHIYLNWCFLTNTQICTRLKSRYFRPDSMGFFTSWREIKSTQRLFLTFKLNTLSLKSILISPRLSAIKMITCTSHEKTNTQFLSDESVVPSLLSNIKRCLTIFYTAIRWLVWVFMSKCEHLLLWSEHTCTWRY